jgi:hypothetical protein
LRPAPIATGKILALNGDFSDLTGSYWITPVVKQHYLNVFGRITDRSDLARELGVAINEELRDISGFGAGHQNSDYTIARKDFLVLLNIAPIYDLAAEGHQPQTRKRLVTEAAREIPYSTYTESRD